MGAKCTKRCFFDHSTYGIKLHRFFASYSMYYSHLLCSWSYLEMKNVHYWLFLLFGNTLIALRGFVGQATSHAPQPLHFSGSKRIFIVESSKYRALVEQKARHAPQWTHLSTFWVTLFERGSTFSPDSLRYLIPLSKFFFVPVRSRTSNPSLLCDTRALSILNERS